MSIAQQRQPETYFPVDHYARGCRGERAVCKALSPLAYQAFHHLDDRRWPGLDRANVDHVVVGPTGIFLVDAKMWSGQLTVAGHQLLQNGVNREGRLQGLERLATAVDDVLVGAGFAVRSVPVVCFAGSSPSDHATLSERIMLTDVSSLADRLRSRPPVLRTEDVEQIRLLLAELFVEYEVDDADTDDALIALDEAEHTGLSAALERSMQSWLTWLAPEQRAVVTRSFPGPARIRGAAGTGKTTIGLHRLARAAATTSGPLLWVSYVKTLSPVMREAYRRIAPETVDKVEFTHLHDLAAQLLKARGVTYKVDTTTARRAFRAAWAECGTPLAIDETGLAQAYFEDEIEHVIKGRGIPDVETYLRIDRVGRRTAFLPERRQQVWALYEAYQRALSDAGVCDMVDPIALALAEVRREPWAEPFTAVVVDEVQDLPAVGVMLLHALVGDRPDGLLILGDGQQKIYSGGWTLADTGVDIAGRGVVLKTNYRNTVEILARASSVLRGDEYDDLDGVRMLSERGTTVVRHGAEPRIETYSTQIELDGAVVRAVDAVVASAPDPGDVAVLLPTNPLAEAYIRLLADSGIEAVSLRQWDGGPIAAIRVGTYHRAKGLEFRHVLLPRTDWLPQTSGAGRTDDVRSEQAELKRRQLFVAMTRARDGLWLGGLERRPTNA